MATPSAVMLLLLAPLLCESFGSFSDTAENGAASQNHPSVAVGAAISGGSSGLSEEEVNKLRRLLQDADQRAAEQASLATSLTDENTITFSCSFKDVTVSRVSCNKKTGVCTDVGTLVYMMSYMKGFLNCYILQFFLLSNSCFYFAVAMVLQFHIRWRISAVIKDTVKKYCKCSGFVEGCSFHIARLRLRRIGMSIIILNLWFNPSWVYRFPSRQCFSLSVIVLFIDSYFLFYAAELLLSVLHKSALFPPYANGRKKNGLMLSMKYVVDPTDEAQDIPVKPDCDEAFNMYMDLTVKFGTVLALFVLQAFLMIMYAEVMMSGGDDSSLEKAGELDHLDKVDLARWIAGVMLGMMQGDAQMGEDFNSRYWQKLFFSKTVVAGEGEAQEAEEGEAQRRVQDPEAEEREAQEDSLRQFGKLDHIDSQVKIVFFWWMRCAMDFFINGFGRLIIMNTFPIMLCVEGPLDFVKDCTAVLFITTLDDLDDGKSKSLKMMAVALKFSRRWVQKRSGAVGTPHAEQSTERAQPLLRNQDELLADGLLTAEERKYAVDPDNQDKFKKATTWAKVQWDELIKDSDGHWASLQNKIRPVCALMNKGA